MAPLKGGELNISLLIFLLKWQMLQAVKRVGSSPRGKGLVVRAMGRLSRVHKNEIYHMDSITACICVLDSFGSFGWAACTLSRQF